MISLSSGIGYVDLQFRGRPGVIATAVLHASSGVALVDPGPSSSLPALQQALAAAGIATPDIHSILLTHIHLDHAGGTGTLARANPGLRVFVHEAGARHLADPGKLLASAGRLYGDDMQRLWGEVLPVPAAQLQVLQGGERLAVAGRELEVAYTPGHAVHHVSLFEPESRIAFVGDTGGVRRGTGAYVMPVTPPPDIDLAAWDASASRIAAWSPDTLFCTHFGPYPAARHFDGLMSRLGEWSRLARRLVGNASLSEEDREAQFVADVSRDLQRTVGAAEAELYVRAGRIEYSWQGLARYWRKHT